MRNFRLKWVLRYDPNNKQFRLVRIMWETQDAKCSYKLSFSIKRLLPRITIRKSFGGTYV
jgi:hypothetical protein